MLKIILLFTVSVFIYSQDIVGTWSGKLVVPNAELPVVFHVSNDGNGYTSKMDSPAEMSFDNPVDVTRFENNELTIELIKFGVKFSGKLSNGKISGVFKQGPANIPLVLEKMKHRVKAKLQEPKKPYPYKSVNVVFKNEAAGGINLAGTLTLPKDIEKPPVAILISGSGPQNRDEELLGHKPFLVLSDHLTRNGIAVLRFDDRGVGESEGDFKSATSFDFATDVEAAFEFLKKRTDINTKKIGLIGHSEGGMIAPIVASRNSDIAFNVLLAGPGVSGAKVLLAQVRRASELAGKNEEDIALNEKYSEKIFEICANMNGDASIKNIRDLLVEMREKASGKMKLELTDDKINSQIKRLTSPWMKTFLAFEPDIYLSKVMCPILALNGSKDFQVIASLNLPGIEKSLRKAGNKDYTVKKLDGMNHIFQVCETGAFSEYAMIDETISPKALNEISRWINKRF